MERSEEMERPAERPPDANERSAVMMAPRPTAPITSQCDGHVCPRCAAADASAGAALQASNFIYALGHIEPRFPRIGIEKEFAQAIGRAEFKGQTDRQALHKALTSRENRYLARQLCWVLTVQGLETYLLEPRDPMDLDLLVQVTEPRPAP
jgi:hypothetical protein